MIKLYLIRHGETNWNINGIYQGSSDVELNKNGLQQAKLLAGFMKNIQIDKLYSSTLKRAYTTAELIANNNKIKLETNAGFNEISFGALEGKNYKEIQKGWPGLLDTMYTDPANVKLPEGESYLQLQERAIGAFNEVIKGNDENSIAIICHGGTIRVLLCALLNLSLDYTWCFKQENTAVNIVEYNGNTNFVSLINSTFHLNKFKK